MQHSVKVTLSRSNLIVFGVMITCDCGMPTWIPNVDAEPFAMWNCTLCERPLVVISADGKMYYVGKKVLNRGVDESG